MVKLEAELSSHQQEALDCQRVYEGETKDRDVLCWGLQLESTLGKIYVLKLSHIMPLDLNVHKATVEGRGRC